MGDAITGGPDTSCNITSACVSTGTLGNIANYRAAVARLIFVKDGGQYLCSGSLLNDSDNSGFIPYLLTANHCFSTQASASSLEAYWDYHPSSCGGLLPALGALPRSTGGTLLASSGNSDFTFLRLTALPPAGANGRIYLGWNAASAQPAEGSSVYGVHHPNGGEQSYTRSTIDRTPAQTCTGAPTARFLYANPVNGATFGAARARRSPTAACRWSASSSAAADRTRPSPATPAPATTTSSAISPPPTTRSPPGSTPPAPCPAPTARPPCAS